ncbi:hypothetical protein D3C74_287590 [compost metagenome]
MVAVHGLAVRVRDEHRVDRVLDRVRSQTHEGDEGSLEVVVAVDAHRLPEERPPVGCDPQRRLGLCQQLARARCARLDLDDLGLVELAGVELVARDDAQRTDASQHREVRGVRRVGVEQAGRVGEEVDRTEGLDLPQRLGPRVRGGVDHERRAITQRAHAHAVLHRVHGRVVRGAVGLDATDGPHVRGRRDDQRDLLGQVVVELGEVALVVGPHDQVVACPRPGGALADRREDVGPHVQERQHVVAVVGVRDVQQHRAVGQVEPQVRVEGVEVGADDRPEVGGRERAQVVERVGRPEPRADPRLHVGALATCQVHGHERVEIEVRLLAQRAQIVRQLSHDAPSLGAEGRRARAQRIHGRRAVRGERGRSSGSITVSPSAGRARAAAPRPRVGGSTDD